MCKSKENMYVVAVHSVIQLLYWWLLFQIVIPAIPTPIAYIVIIACSVVSVIGGKYLCSIIETRIVMPLLEKKAVKAAEELTKEEGYVVDHFDIIEIGGMTSLLGYMTDKKGIYNGYSLVLLKDCKKAVYSRNIKILRKTYLKKIGAEKYANKSDALTRMIFMYGRDE